MSRDKSTLPLVIFFIVGILLLWQFSPTKMNSIDRQLFVYAPENIRLFTLGYDEVIADSLWLRVLQDFDQCDQAAAPKAENGKSICQKGWAYSMIKAVTELDPKFKIAHTAGAELLSVVINDKTGASEIFDLAVQRFPKDWRVSYYAGYHAMAEMHENTKAAQYLEIAGQNGAPPWVHALAAKLYSKEGRLDLAKSVLEQTLQNGTAGEYQERIETRLKEVIKEIEDSPEK